MRYLILKQKSQCIKHVLLKAHSARERVEVLHPVIPKENKPMATKKSLDQSLEGKSNGQEIISNDSDQRSVRISFTRETIPMSSDSTPIHKGKRTKREEKSAVLAKSFIR